MKDPMTKEMLVMTSPNPTGTVTNERRSAQDDDDCEDEHTTDDEKDMYSTLVRELKRIDRGDKPLMASTSTLKEKLSTVHEAANRSARRA